MTRRGTRLCRVGAVLVFAGIICAGAEAVTLQELVSRGQLPANRVVELQQESDKELSLEGWWGLRVAQPLPMLAVKTCGGGGGGGQGGGSGYAGLDDNGAGGGGGEGGELRSLALRELPKGEYLAWVGAPGKGGKDGTASYSGNPGGDGEASFLVSTARVTVGQRLDDPAVRNALQASAIFVARGGGGGSGGPGSREPGAVNNGGPGGHKTTGADGGAGGAVGGAGAAGTPSSSGATGGAPGGSPGPYNGGGGGGGGAGLGAGGAGGGGGTHSGAASGADGGLCAGGGGGGAFGELQQPGRDGGAGGHGYIRLAWGPIVIFENIEFSRSTP